MYENTMNRKEAKKQAKKKAAKEGQKLVNHMLDFAEERQNHAINRNNMIGEDFRSQALNNYHKILRMEEEILRLKAEPYITRQNYLRLMTKVRRANEKRHFEKEDDRQERLRLLKIIDGKD